jgi:hypothetical protein
MNWRRILIGTVAVGILANVVDYVLHTYIIGGWWTSLPFAAQEAPMMWFVIGDFAAVFMLMVAWDKVGAAFGSGSSGGMRFGMMAGAFVSFPATLFWGASIAGFPYSLAWKYVIVGILWYTVMGAAAGMLDGKEA